MAGEHQGAGMKTPNSTASLKNAPRVIAGIHTIKNNFFFQTKQNEKGLM